MPVKGQTPYFANHGSVGTPRYDCQLNITTLERNTYKRVRTTDTITIGSGSLDIPEVRDGSLLLTNDEGQTWHGRDVPDAQGNMQYPSKVDSFVQDQGARALYLSRLTINEVPRVGAYKDRGRAMSWLSDLNSADLADVPSICDTLQSNYIQEHSLLFTASRNRSSRLASLLQVLF